jgi:hypothetical protein
VTRLVLDTASTARLRLLGVVVASVVQAACAQSVVSAPGEQSDGGTSRDASDGGPGLRADVAMSLRDAEARDAEGDAGVAVRDSGEPSSACMTELRQDIQVPSPSAPHAFQGVRSLVFDSARRLHVLSRQGPPFTGWVSVHEPAPSHRFIRGFGREQIRVAEDVVVRTNGDVLVLDWDPNGTAGPVVHEYDVNGTFRRTIELGGGIDEAWGLALDDSGTLYVAGQVVARYDANGGLIDSIGRFGGAAGAIGIAKAVALDPRGYVWVASFIHNSLQQYDVSTRALVQQIGGRGVGPGLFDGDAADDWRWGPTRVALDGQGALYANDPYVGRIQKLSRQGVFLGEFGFGNTMEIGPVRVEPQTGNVYVGRGTGVAIVCPL